MNKNKNCSLILQIQSKIDSLLGFTKTCAAELLLETETLVLIAAN